MNDLFYLFPDNGCKHENFIKNICVWELNDEPRFNHIMECKSCGGFSETNPKTMKKQGSLK